jgi:hypothetical protein
MPGRRGSWIVELWMSIHIFKGSPIIQNRSLFSRIMFAAIAIWALTPSLQNAPVVTSHSTSLSSNEGSDDVAPAADAADADVEAVDGSLVEQSLVWGDDCPANGDFQTAIDKEEKSITCKVTFTVEGGRKITGQITVARSGSNIEITPDFKGCKDTSQKTHEFRDITKTNSRAKQYTTEQVQYCMMAEGTVLESDPDSLSILSIGKVSIARLAAVISCRQTLTGKAIPESDQPECYKQFAKYLPRQGQARDGNYTDLFLTSPRPLSVPDLHLIPYHSPNDSL